MMTLKPTLPSGEPTLNLVDYRKLLCSFDRLWSDPRAAARERQMDRLIVAVDAGIGRQVVAQRPLRGWGGYGGSRHAGEANPQRPRDLARMRHGPDGGGFFLHGGDGFAGGGSDDFSRGRKFSSDDLQLLLLALLLEGPRHGYELIKLLETRSNGFYTPSPGMVYPALTYLEELGYTTVASEGNRKCYALTDAGRAHLEANRERVDMVWAKLSFFARKIGLVRRALAGEDTDGSAGKEPFKALHDARHKLKQLVIERMDAPLDEQARIAKVLERAIAEIEASPEHAPE